MRFVARPISAGGTSPRTLSAAEAVNMTLSARNSNKSSTFALYKAATGNVRMFFPPGPFQMVENLGICQSGQ
jgi:hypothetical protein